MRAAHTNELVLDPRAFPVVRPQVTWVDDDVYFGSWPIARVTDVETRFLEVCDGTRTLSDAVRAADVDARCAARVASWLLWWDAELDEPLEASAPLDRLVLSARHVDAWLGMGGRLGAEASRQRTAVITCFGSLGATRFVQAFPTPMEATASSRDEAAMVARLAGTATAAWEFPDRDWRTALEETEERHAALADAIRTLLLHLVERHVPKQVFAPAALGSSPDARLLFHTALGMYADGTLDGELHFYEDEPAIGGYRSIDEFLARFEGSFLTPREYYVDVTAAFARKASLVDAFRCTLDEDDRQAWCESAERTAAVSGIDGTRYAERFWRVDVEPMR
jgi:hypothetical protein